ncbi:MAG: Hpt domain-containing protein, partial [Lachnospiraceae bacterium]|nr:Hpt domain-containing protein [Lachnospiraceae bacterium]
EDKLLVYVANDKIYYVEASQADRKKSTPGNIQKTSPATMTSNPADAGKDDGKDIGKNTGTINSAGSAGSGMMEFTPGDGVMEFAPDDGVMEFSPDDGVMDFAPAGSGEAGQIAASAGSDTADGRAAAEKEIDYDQVITNLKNQGVNTEKGLAYCAGDKEFYAELLDDYAKAAVGKCRELTNYLEQENLAEYRIRVHAVKGTSMCIGAMEVHDIAKALEEAAAKGDIAAVRADHQKLVDAYGQIAKVISGELG